MRSDCKQQVLETNPLMQEYQERRRAELVRLDQLLTPKIDSWKDRAAGTDLHGHIPLEEVTEVLGDIKYSRTGLDRCMESNGFVYDNSEFAIDSQGRPVSEGPVYVRFV
jgi:hypothetical protein